MHFSYQIVGLNAQNRQAAFAYKLVITLHIGFSIETAGYQRTILLPDVHQTVENFTIEEVLPYRIEVHFFGYRERFSMRTTLRSLIS